VTSDLPHTALTVNDVLEGRYPFCQVDIVLAKKISIWPQKAMTTFMANFHKISKPPYMPPARELMDGAHDTRGTLQIRIRFVLQSRPTNAGYH
jgi:hypothetical protein